MSANPPSSPRSAPGPVARSFPNTEAGWQQLTAWVAEQPGSLVIMEATGRYHLGIWEALERAGIGVAVCNPQRLHYWIKSQGQRAKTDRLDAIHLARYGAARQPEPTPLPSTTQRTIAALVGRRQQLIKDQTRLQHQLELADEAVVEDLTDQLADVQRRIGAMEAKLATATAADPQTDQRVRLLATAPGVAHLTAARLVAELPELGQLTGNRSPRWWGWRPSTTRVGTYAGGHRWGAGGFAPCALSADRHHDSLRSDLCGVLCPAASQGQIGQKSPDCVPAPLSGRAQCHGACMDWSGRKPTSPKGCFCTQSA